jgi:hypothetical protein
LYLVERFDGISAPELCFIPLTWSRLWGVTRKPWNMARPRRRLGQDPRFLIRPPLWHRHRPGHLRRGAAKKARNFSALPSKSLASAGRCRWERSVLLELDDEDLRSLPLGERKTAGEACRQADTVFRDAVI